MLNEEMIPRLFELYEDRDDHLWWMQDGAPCHRTNVVRVTRGIWKPNHWTWTCSGMATSQPRPNTLRFLGGYWKNKVNETSLTDPQHLRDHRTPCY